MSPFLDELRLAAPDLRILTDPLDLAAYQRDETVELPAEVPLAVALPTSTAEVVAIVRAAAANRVPITPRGGGTSLSGGAIPSRGAIVISFARMDRILELDEANQVAVVQPGVINKALKDAAAARGLWYAPDPASYETCTLGGNIATNAGGLCCVKYGVTRDAVLSLEVVLADGSVVRTGGRNVKDVAGYDLTSLFVGSMGTLAIVTEATLRLIPLPPPSQTLLAFFATIEDAGRGVAGVVRAGVRPSTLELMDQFTIRAVNAAFGLGLDDEAAAMLLVESDLPGGAAADELIRAEQACDAAASTFTIRARDAAESDLLRTGRRQAHAGLERLGSLRREDVAVPRSRVPELLARIAEIAARERLRMGVFGHAGDGNLHPTMVFDQADAGEVERVLRAEPAILQATLDLGGTVSGEHGIGISKRAWLEPTRGARAVEAMRALKTALDPLGILNPGKVL